MADIINIKFHLLYRDAVNLRFSTNSTRSLAVNWRLDASGNTEIVVAAIILVFVYILIIFEVSRGCTKYANR